jgi:hypothetical protein
MLLIHIVPFLVVVTGVIHGCDANADLARGLVYNASVIIAAGSNAREHFSDYPEDYAAVYLNTNALNQHVTSSIYEILAQRRYFYP